MTDFKTLAERRYSVRKFDTKKVEQEKINLLLEVGRLAPTACNNQPQRILVLDSEDSLNRLKNCTPFHFNAPLAIIVCYDNMVSWKRPFDNEEMGVVDASIVAAHIMLETVDLGLGSTWVGHFDPKKVREYFSLPANIIPVTILPIGYPDRESTPHQNHTKRFDVNALSSYNLF